MGLHNKTRKILFNEFIERNYRDTKSSLKKGLLKISPDEILESHESLAFMVHFIDRFSDFILELELQKQSKKDSYRVICDFVKKELPVKNVIIYKFSNHEGKTLSDPSRMPDSLPQKLKITTKKLWKENNKGKCFLLKKTESHQPIYNFFPDAYKILFCHTPSFEGLVVFKLKTNFSNPSETVTYDLFKLIFSGLSRFL